MKKITMDYEEYIKEKESIKKEAFHEWQRIGRGEVYDFIFYLLSNDSALDEEIMDTKQGKLSFYSSPEYLKLLTLFKQLRDSANEVKTSKELELEKDLRYLIDAVNDCGLAVYRNKELKEKYPHLA